MYARFVHPHMPVTRESEIVEFDAVAVREATRDAAEGPVFSLVEFDFEDFNPLYVADETVAMYTDEDHMMEHFERIHDYVNLDFTELQLFTEELLPTEDRVHFITTALDNLKVVRYYRDEQGLFVALSADEEVQSVVDAIEESVEA